MVIELPIVEQGGRRYPRARITLTKEHKWAVQTELRPGIFVSKAGKTEPATTTFTTWPAALAVAVTDVQLLRRYQEAPGVGDPL